MDRNAVVAAHTGLSILGWTVLFPIGIYIASFERDRLPNWTVVYQGVKCAAAAVLSIAYIIYMTIGLYAVNNTYNIFTHILMAWLLLHMIAMALHDNQQKTIYGKLFRTSGVLLMFAGLALTGLGLADQPWMDQSVGIAFGLYLVTVVVVFLWAQMHMDLERKGHLQTLVVGPPPSFFVIQQRVIHKS